MRTRPVVSVPLIIGIVLLFVHSPAVADDAAPREKVNPESVGLSRLLDVVSKSSLPSLSGLIQPEKMGVLTDNQCRIKDNQPHLLSDNEATVKLMSDIHVLSGITVNLHVHVTIERETSGKAKNDHGKRKSSERRSMKKASGRKASQKRKRR